MMGYCGMMKMMNKLASFIGMYKVYLGRTNSYWGLVNSGMILFIFLQNLNTGIDFTKHIILIYGFGFITPLIVGPIDAKLGIFKNEFRHSQRYNPYINDIRDDVKELKEMMKNESKR
jgi:hypothetical protein